MSLKSRENSWIAGDIQICDHIDHFKNMFKSECPYHLEGALVGLYLVVSDAVNSEMLQPFTLEDIKVVVHELRKECIPLGDLSSCDRLIWHWTEIGEYSVKSGYALRHSIQEDPLSSQAVWFVLHFSYKIDVQAISSFDRWFLALSAFFNSVTTDRDRFYSLVTFIC
ncbi:hypothetical protein ACFX19_007200 [Malus domestica]